MGRASLMRSGSSTPPITSAASRIANAQWWLNSAHYPRSWGIHHSQGCSSTDHQQHRRAPCELTPEVPPSPPCQPPPGPRASLASSALRLDCLHANPPTTSVDQSAEVCLYHPAFVLAVSQRMSGRLDVSSNVPDTPAH